MSLTTRVACWAAAFLLLVSAAAQDRDFSTWSDQQIQLFLLEGEVVETVTLAEGVTNSIRATVEWKGVRHDAHFQPVDESAESRMTPNGVEENFRDSWTYNIAAYRLSRLLNIENIPVSVERQVEGRLGALTWWIDNVMMSEKTRYMRKLQPPDIAAWNRAIHTVRVFDELIYNTDRNLGNLIITEDWTLWMIDHTRAFRLHKQLRAPQQLSRCDARLLEALRGLDRASLDELLDGYLNVGEPEALLARRDLIVAFFDQQVEEKGAPAVLIGAEP